MAFVRSWLVLTVLFAAILIAGCSSIISQKTTFNSEALVWNGRLAIKVEDQPSQSFSSSFQLKGSAHSGELSLLSPLGSVLALLNWEPQGASLRTGNELRTFASLEALMQAATGTAIPVAALFDWLAGVATPVEGWQVDLSQQAQGRFVARRTQPATELRFILERE